MSKTILLLLLSLLLFSGCEERVEPVVTIRDNFTLPITCMRLDSLGVEKEFIYTLKNLYTFDESCDLTLSISYKKDIVCNSTQNIQMKNMGKFPKSYLKLKLRKGLEIKYSYYLDLYNNIESDDIEKGFKRLKQDLIKLKPKE